MLSWCVAIVCFEAVAHWLDSVSNNQIKCVDVPGKKLKRKSLILANTLRFPLCFIILSWVCLIIASGGEGKFCVLTAWNKKSNMKCNDCTHILGSVPSKAFPRTSTHFWSRGRSSSLEQTLLIGKIHINNLPINRNKCSKLILTAWSSSYSIQDFLLILTSFALWFCFSTGRFSKWTRKLIDSQYI